jgi:CRP-like cAMP-binding protein
MRQTSSIAVLRRSEHGALEPAIRRLAALAPLSTEEQALIRGLEGHYEMRGPGSELTSGGAAGAKPLILVEGWACRQRVLPDGRRQIFTFLTPGDAIGMRRDPGPLAMAGKVALTHVTLAHAAPLRAAGTEASDRWPGLALALRRAELEDEGRLLDHITRLGRQSAYERVAHLLLELHQRLSVAGLAQARAFPMPLTQETLADALGLSIVHVNRVLQQLRRERLIEMRAGRATFLEPALLASIADFGTAA